MSDVNIRVSYQSNNGRLGLLLTYETIHTPPISIPMNDEYQMTIYSQLYRYTRILIRRLTVGARTVVRVIYFYPLQPPNAFAETRTVIMFPNLPAIGLRPNNFVINMTDCIGLSPYRRGENDTIITTVLLARESGLFFFDKIII